MSECICNSCKNLKGIVNEDGQVSEYTCEYGYPSENCSECSGETCSEVCSHFLDDSDDDICTVMCAKCGKSLNMVSGDKEEGEVFCVDCYLKGCS